MCRKVIGRELGMGDAKGREGILLGVGAPVASVRNVRGLTGRPSVQVIAEW